MYLYSIYYEHMTHCTHDPVLSRCAWGSGMATPTGRMAAGGSSAFHERVNMSQIEYVQNHWYLWTNTV